MRAVVQRVTEAAVSWTDAKGKEHTQGIGMGLAILLGAGHQDSLEDADRLADKVAQLRIFSDVEGRFNLSLMDVQGEALVVSQFTLYADLRRGRRPSFLGAAEPEWASQLCDRFADRFLARGLTTRTGSFGAHMHLSLVNQGPVTVVLSTDPWETGING
jgi:D-tyrosyl-tRNA(Tyr) deacylase